MPRRISSGLFATLVPVAAFAPLVVFVPACSKDAPPDNAAAIVEKAPATAKTAETPARPATPTQTTAMAAYDAKDYASCADQFTQLATTAKSAKRADAIYSAACCHALAGQTDKAFAVLDDAIAAGFAEAAQIDKDTDLASLHADPRWAKLHDTIAAKVAELDKALTKPALRKELLDMVDQDQKILLALAAKKKDGGSADWKSAEPMTKAHTTRLHEIVKTEGWPGKTMVGEDGAHAAWLLTQHSDLDLAFQKDVLARMKPMVDSGEVSEVDYAYLEDRVAVGEHRKQRYGTQFKDGEPQPIEDEAHVDERRVAIGMPSMAEYRKQMIKMYGDQKKK